SFFRGDSKDLRLPVNIAHIKDKIPELAGRVAESMVANQVEESFSLFSDKLPVCGAGESPIISQSGVSCMPGDMTFGEFLGPAFDPENTCGEGEESKLFDFFSDKGNDDPNYSGPDGFDPNRDFDPNRGFDPNRDSDDRNFEMGERQVDTFSKKEEVVLMLQGPEDLSDIDIPPEYLGEYGGEIPPGGFDSLPDDLPPEIRAKLPSDLQGKSVEELQQYYEENPEEFEQITEEILPEVMGPALVDELGCIPESLLVLKDVQISDKDGIAKAVGQVVATELSTPNSSLSFLTDLPDEVLLNDFLPPETWTNLNEARDNVSTGLFGLDVATGLLAVILLLFFVLNYNNLPSALAWAGAALLLGSIFTITLSSVAMAFVEPLLSELTNG
ncbi:MAG: hypothetical protein GOV15_02910, partial [Candidatus Diapherotrites archaeon]|nr:hypothetical protein [Candidatus Diapherotrites archaeon]